LEILEGPQEKILEKRKARYSRPRPGPRAESQSEHEQRSSYYFCGRSRGMVVNNRRGQSFPPRRKENRNPHRKQLRREGNMNHGAKGFLRPLADEKVMKSDGEGGKSAVQPR